MTQNALLLRVSFLLCWFFYWLAALQKLLYFDRKIFVMKYSIFLLIGISFIGGQVLCAQRIVWQKAYGSANNDDIAESMIKDKHGNFVLLGNRSAGTLHIIKTDSDGELMWEKFYSIGLASSLAETDNGYIIGGLGKIMMLDYNGDSLWTKKYSSVPGSYIDQIIRLSDGSFLLHFYSIWNLLNINDEGDSLWAVEKSGFTIVDTDGFTVIRDSVDRILLSKYSNSGERVFEKIISYVEGQDFTRGVVKTREGEYLIYSRFIGGGVGFTMVNAEGDFLWTNNHMESSNILPQDVKQTRDSGFVVSGAIDALGGKDIYLLKINSFGEYQWSDAIPRPFMDEVANNIFLECDTSIVLFGAGENGPIGGDDLLLVKVDSLDNIIGFCENQYCENEITTEEPYFLYPNPARSIISVKTSETISAKIEISDIQGKKVLTFEIREQDCFHFDVSNLPFGMYFLCIKSNDNKILKFLKL